MTKRLFWFVSGMFAGAYAMVWGKRKATAVAEQVTPGAILNVLVDAARSVVTKLLALYKKQSQAPVLPAPRQYDTQ